MVAGFSCGPFHREAMGRMIHGMNFDPSLLSTLGLELPGPVYLIGSILFGLLGIAAWRKGRKTAHPRTKWLGVALMFYPYAVSNTWLLYVVGLLLCAGIYVDQR
jgi:hypothetical protein